MKSQRERDQIRLNNIFLEMGMDKNVASIISGVDKRKKEKEKDKKENNRGKN